MRKLFFFFIAATIASQLLAQDEDMPKASAASRKYHEYRGQITEPSYGLAKVKALIKKIKPKNVEDDMGDLSLPDKTFDALTVEEKFTYTMLHGEIWSQVCDVSFAMQGEEKMIFAYFPSMFGGEQLWSPRQREFLKKNRTKVISLVKETMTSKKRIGVNLKEAIVEVNAYELIPDIIAMYNRDKKDHDILTLLFLLMKEGNYKPFIESAAHAKLYSEDARYDAYLTANAQNQKLTLDRATAYYKTKVKPKK
ncbi:MAG: hypothetical protein KF784_00805 [Fimbriimonadaceae bacterium]|nr:hypothetical protein [Fimbriimonadaceae bacterium]